jgi:putative IMPACT (imprinted ancient) family translation regulator
VGEITAVVVRYYGGILLGTGGLVKAYGGGVQQALNLLITTARRHRIYFVVRLRSVIGISKPAAKAI